VASNYAGSTDGGWLVFGEWQLTTAPEITQRLEAPAVKVPPPVLQEDGKINKEYFGVLAAEKGPYIMNKPPNFEHDYAADRIERCVQTQEVAQTVHGSTSLDLKAVQAYVGQKVTPSLHNTRASQLLPLRTVFAGMTCVVSVKVTNSC
jgi:hypothetical protein